MFLACEMMKVENDSFADIKDWISQVGGFMEKKETKKFLESQFMVNKSIAYLKRVLYMGLLKMVSSGASGLELKHLEVASEESYSLDKKNTNDLLIKDLSVVEICLLVAIKHINQIYDNEPFNFEVFLKKSFKLELF